MCIWCHLLVITLEIVIHYIHYNSCERRNVQHRCRETVIADETLGTRLNIASTGKKKKICLSGRTRTHDLPDNG